MASASRIEKHKRRIRGKNRRLKLILRYIGFFKPYIWATVRLSLLITLSAAISVAIPQFPRYAIDVILPSGRLDHVFYLAGAGIVILAIYSLIDYWTVFLSFFITQDVILDIRIRVFRHLQLLHLAFFETRLSGALLTRVINDVNQLQEMTQAGINRLGRMFVTLIAVLIMMLLLDWRLTLSVLAILPPMGYIIFRYGARLRAAALKSSKQMAELTGMVSEVLQGVSVVKAFTAEDYELERFSDESREYRNLQNLQRREVGIVTTTADFASNLGTVVVAAVGCWLAITRGLKIGDLTAFLLYTGMIFRPVVNLVMFYGVFQRGMASAERIFELLDTRDEVPEIDEPLPLPDGGGLVEFDGVTFAYKEGSPPVLKDVSIRIEPRKTTALVGLSGAGKTTIVKLIPRFYDVQEGAIRLDGADVRDLSINRLRGEIGMVLQESFLFSGTVRDNIAYGKPRSSHEEIESAARLANAHDFIMELPDGYDTEIGERGVKLSGGQKQRIAIARAILRNPRVLILDEATSNLDSESELLIRSAIDNLLEGRTTIVIAHRLSTIIKADKIIVVENGSIAATGKHMELLETSPVYKRLYELQFRNEG